MTSDAQASPTDQRRVPDPLEVTIPDDITARYPALRPIGARRPLVDYLGDLWNRREFALTLPLGELRAQNQNTLLGQSWHLLNPLLLVFVYWLVFDIFLGVGSSDGGGAASEAASSRSSLFAGENYLGFLVAGIIPFTYTQKSMQSGARMIIANRKLVQTINFPRAVLPISALVTEGLAQLPALAVMVILMAATGEPITWLWLLVVPAFVLQTMFNAGLALFTARITFHFQDFQQILPYILRLAFYISGIIFSIEIVRDRSELVYTLLLLNPINAFVAIFRGITLESASSPYAWEIAAGWTVVILIGGFLYFRAAESEYGRV